MPLREELERSGNWLFRWRSYLPLFLIVPMMLAMRTPHHLSQKEGRLDAWALCCMAVSLCGLAIRALAVGHAPAGTSGRNTHQGQIAETLNTTGLYSVVRHPLYLGNFIIWMGVSLYAMIWWLPALFALAFWLYYERIMFAEEEFLRRKFGDEYVRWADRTPAFVPRLGGWRTGGWRLDGWRRPDLPFSFKTVLKREYSGLFGIVACFYVLDLYERLAVERQFIFDPLWTWLFAAGLAVFLVLRALKRRTSMLAVEGR